MTDYPRKNLERVRERIKNTDMDPNDRKLIREFDTLLKHDGIGKNWHAMVLDYIRLVASRRDAHGASLSELLDSKPAVLDFLDWLKEGEYYDKETNELYEFGEKTQSHYRSSIRKFGKILNDGELPEPLEIVYGGNRRKVSETAPKEWEVLLWHQDVVPLIKACENLRDQALIAVAWDSGARPFEISNLTYGDVSPDGDFLKITVGGKNTPLRDPRLVIASPFLKKWLEIGHPASDEGEEFCPETPIWTWLEERTELGKDYLRSIIPSTIAPRIDLNKPANLRNFRKSRASVLASREEIGRGDLEERLGWATGSKIVAVYVTRFGSGTDDKISKSDGLDEEFLPDSENEEFPDPAPVKCPNCSRWTPRYDNKCIWCATKFNPEAAQEAKKSTPDTPTKDKARRDLLDMVTDGEIDKEDIESARQLANVVSRYPELLDYADQIQDLLDRFDVDEEE